MRILIVGGYGFIGSYAAERLNKEGHQLSILDNLSTGDQRNVPIKHSSHILHANDPKAEEIFRNDSIDALIFLASPNQLHEEEVAKGTQDHISGLVNMLTYSVKYQVKKFIYVSSAAVYGVQEAGTSLSEKADCHPQTPYAFNHLTSESYCQKWRELYQLDTLCLRVSNVYGFRRYSKGPGGVVHDWLSQLVRGKELVVYGSGDLVRDFIYVEDVVDAIYRSLYSEYTGVLNISSNTRTSLAALVNILEKQDLPVDLQYKPARQLDTSHSRIDHTRALKILDWAPFYLIEEGLLEKTYPLYLKASMTEEKEEKKDRWLVPPLLKGMLPYGENALAFGITVFFTLLPPELGFFLMDYKILYILLMGLLYGSKQAVLAVVLSWGLYAYDYLSKGLDYTALFYEPNHLAHMVFYLFIGLVVGYRIDKKNSDMEMKSLDFGALEDRYEFLQLIHQDTRMVKEELQNQLLNSEDSLGKIYNIAKKLDSLEPEKIFLSAVQMLETVMKSQHVSIYTVSANKGFMRLTAQSRMAKDSLPVSLRLSEEPLLREVLKQKSVYVNKSLDNQYPLLLAPVFDGEEAIAMVMIHRMEFEYFNLYYQNLLHVVINLISSALSRAFRYLNASKHERLVEGTDILKMDYMVDVLNNKREGKRMQGIDFSVLEVVEVRTEESGLEELSLLVSVVLREQDYIGMGTSGNILIVLSNTGEEGVNLVQKRLIDRGVITMRLEEFIYV